MFFSMKLKAWHMNKLFKITETYGLNKLPDGNAVLMHTWTPSESSQGVQVLKRHK